MQIAYICGPAIKEKFKLPSITVPKPLNHSSSFHYITPNALISTYKKKMVVIFYNRRSAMSKRALKPPARLELATPDWVSALNGE